MSKNAHAHPAAPTTAVAETPKGGALAAVPPPPAQEILSSDITIPRLLLMQGLSEFVVEGKSRPGLVVRSTTIEELAKPGDVLDFIPLKITTAWADKERVGQKFEFRRAYPRTPHNEGLPWQFWRNPQGQEFDKPGQLGATEWQRVKSIDVYALLPKDLAAFDAEMKKTAESGEMPDLSKTVLPVVISFRSTSFNAGKAVSTHFARVEEMRQSVPDIRAHWFTLPLGCKPEKNEKGSYFVYEVGNAKGYGKELRPRVERWMSILNSGKELKVDSTGESEAVQEAGKY